MPCTLAATDNSALCTAFAAHAPANPTPWLIPAQKVSRVQMIYNCTNPSYPAYAMLCCGPWCCEHQHQHPMQDNIVFFLTYSSVCPLIGPPSFFPSLKSCQNLAPPILNFNPSCCCYITLTDRDALLLLFQLLILLLYI